MNPSIVNPELTAKFEQLKTMMIADYRGRNRISKQSQALSQAHADIREDMAVEYERGLSVTYGSKYAKIVTGRSVWGFVVIDQNDKKFPFGSILKAASYNAPTRNFARGSIFNLDKFNARWTGA